jgi:thioredoxin reductase
LAQLARQGIQLREERVLRLDGRDGQLERIVFEDESALERKALFFHGPVRLASALPEQLGCALTKAGRIEVDEAGRTSVADVYAAGDAARRSGQHPATQVIFAAASGSLAAIALHQELMQEEVGLTPLLPQRDAALPRI